MDRTARRNQDVADTTAKSFIATVKIAIKYLDYSHCGRQYDPAISQRLQSVFASEGCLRFTDTNYVPVLVTSDQLQSILRSSDTSLEALQTETLPEITLVIRKLRCLHSQHRLAAALDFLPVSEQWWIANLYLSTEERELSKFSKFVQSQKERYDH
ncbi:MAG: hypothetical protein M1818_003031 [Claussenomyces sp. TS43310]|nr:MAG: hypothetical protein M1818_003031 [Claussenomyces sp. TS43310]